MGQFIVSARKYRPANFEALIGQENIAKTLKNSILRDQLAHAYLFCGPRGVGKTSAARIFAKTINCSNPTADMEPCGECESCRSFAEGRSYSIHELDAASNNSVDDIRMLTDKVRIPPQIGKYSVYIIDEVHMLSQAAFNAFLKTLEEPPAHAIFILATTEKHKILPTILSRCQRYDFSRISIDNIVRNLRDIAGKEGVNIGDDALHIIAQKADGAMRDALTLFDQTVAFCGMDITYEQVIKNLNVLDYEYYFTLTDDFLRGDYAHALTTFDDILNKGFNPLHFISGLSLHFRDLLVCKSNASGTLLELAPSVAQKYQSFSERCSVGFLFEALNCTTTCEAGYKTSGNQRLLIEFALMRICKIMQGAQFVVTAAAAPPAAAAASVAAAATAAASVAAAVSPAISAPAAASAPAASAASAAVAPQPESAQPVAHAATSATPSGVLSQTNTAAQAVASATPAASVSSPAAAAASSAAASPVHAAAAASAPAASAAVSASAFAASPAAQTSASHPSRFSLKSILDEVKRDEERAEEVKARERAQLAELENCRGDEPITEEHLFSVWEKMAENESAPRLSSAIASTKPRFDKETKQIFFAVGNDAQKSWIDKNCRARLENFLRCNLRDKDLTLVVEVPAADESGERKTLYMPSSKAEYLQKNSPEFRELQKDMGLELA